MPLRRSSSRRSLSSARRASGSNGGHLATIESDTVSGALRSVLGSPAGLPRAAWIGLEMKKSGAKKEWRWSNGAALTAPAWSSGEPNDFYGDGSEACAEWLVADGKWNDTRCTLRVPFLCQMGKTPLSCATGNYASLLDGKYCLAKAGYTFADAKKQCAQMGGSLAGPISESENEVLRKALASRFSATRFWIGLSDVAEEVVRCDRGRLRSVGSRRAERPSERRLRRGPRRHLVLERLRLRRGQAVRLRGPIQEEVSLSGHTRPVEREA